MSQSIVIQAAHVSKEYRLGSISHGTLYRDLQSWWASIRGRPDPNARIVDQSAPVSRSGVAADGDCLFALNDVSFEVERGETFGIVGRNGAGKSTLLKILSRVTAPTRGTVRIRGRIASLLEVGTGFHPELTGRENVFLNGTILGMTRAEIRRKFDEIVGFSQLEQFIDTPVKRYSSGMYVRLAFSVAAHLDAEILVIDEVLAVGDFDFQKRCLGKMRDVATSGRTVLLVSHNMAAIQNLCSRAILLFCGRVARQGSTGEVIEAYLNERENDNAVSLMHRTDRSGSGILRFAEVKVGPADPGKGKILRTGCDAKIEVWIDNLQAAPLRTVDVGIGIDNLFGDRITVLTTQAVGATIESLPAGRSLVDITIPQLPLVPGRYYLTLFATSNFVIVDWIQNGALFDVEYGDFFGTGRPVQEGQGSLLMRYHVRRVDGTVLVPRPSSRASLS
jgi:lipopolysaccharide transport system ATP-binding protein